MGVAVLGIQHRVALRKESVDRNLIMIGGFGAGSWRRSPQGERG